MAEYKNIVTDDYLAHAMEKAVHSTLYDTYLIEPKVGDCRLENDIAPDNSYIYSIVKMKQGEHCRNILVTGFSQEIPVRILANYGFSNVVDKVIIHDCVEEITNIIYGKLKASLNKNGYEFAMEFPEVIEDKDVLYQKYNSDKKIISLPFIINGHLGHVFIAACN